MVPDARLYDALQQHFGHSRFRPGQLEIIRHVLEGRPTLAVMPTGAGKSLCYQLPSVLFNGVTLVVSPLVALMKDQVDRLRARNIDAAFVNSAQAESERQAVERGVAAGRHRLVFVAPERFRSASFMRALSGVRLSLLAIDEAHCISEWGHAFRPDYELLGDVCASLAPRRILALTATASPDVRTDILRALRIENATVHVAGFDRPNIHLEVHRLASEAEKRDSLVAAVGHARPAIVYCATRKQTVAMARHLSRAGVRAGTYHGGLEADERRATQDAFASGELEVVAATNAFGLGIDKADVRLVVHTEIPRSLEAYYQEVGRAGRDGAPAVGALFFAGKDIFLQKHLLALASPSPRAVSLMYDRARRATSPLSREALSASLPGIRTRAEPLAALAYLESLGVLERQFVSGPLRLQLLGKASGAGESAASALARLLGARRGELEEDVAIRALGMKDRSELRALIADLERRGELRQFQSRGRTQYALKQGASLEEEHLRRLRVRTMREQQRLQQMLNLAQQHSCRRHALLRALGEDYGRSNCGACDVCAGHRITVVRSQLGDLRASAGRSRAASPAS